MMILLYVKFTRNLVFTICPTVMLNIGDSSTRCLENTDMHQQIQKPWIETGQHKINAIADSEIHNLIIN